MGANIGNEGYLDNLIQCFDPANTQCWSGIGSVFYDLGRQKEYPFVFGTIDKAGSGTSTAIRMNGSGSATGTSCFYMVDSPIAITNYTVEAWINPLLDTNNSGIFTRRDETNNRGFYIYATATSNATNPSAIVLTHNATASGQVIVRNALTANVWQHLVVTFKQSDGFANFYVSGAGIGTSGPLPNLITPAVSIRSFIGNWQFTNPGGYGGSIGLIRLWNKVFSSTEVKLLYNQNKGRYGL